MRSAGTYPARSGTTPSSPPRSRTSPRCAPRAPPAAPSTETPRTMKIYFAVKMEKTLSRKRLLRHYTSLHDMIYTRYIDYPSYYRSRVYLPSTDLTMSPASSPTRTRSALRDTDPASAYRPTAFPQTYTPPSSSSLGTMRPRSGKCAT